ncbi:hypothetical protein MSIMFI_03777 [Mycobacterium simulans]|nr:hypothetical protein MSIMFI_03777 [Mycobacterium simulans]
MTEFTCTALVLDASGSKNLFAKPGGKQTAHGYTGICVALGAV